MGEHILLEENYFGSIASLCFYFNKNNTHKIFSLKIKSSSFFFKCDFLLEIEIHFHLKKLGFFSSEKFYIAEEKFRTFTWGCFCYYVLNTMIDLDFDFCGDIWRGLFGILLIIFFFLIWFSGSIALYHKACRKNCTNLKYFCVRFAVFSEGNSPHLVCMYLIAEKPLKS